MALEPRGVHGDDSNPARSVTQFTAPDGELVAENDPFNQRQWALEQIAKRLGLETLSQKAKFPEAVLCAVSGRLDELERLANDAAMQKVVPSNPSAHDFARDAAMELSGMDLSISESEESVVEILTPFFAKALNQVQDAQPLSSSEESC